MAKINKSQSLKPEKILQELSGAINEIHSRFPNLSQDDCFVLWFLRAYLTEDESKAANAISGGANDKGVDAILIDDDLKRVFIVQGKYRKSLGEVTEKRNDILAIVDIVKNLSSENAASFADFLKTANGTTSKLLQDAHERIVKRKYKVMLYFATLGNVTQACRDDARIKLQATKTQAKYEIIDSKRISTLLRDYLDGVAPPIPALELEMEKNANVTVNNIAQRYDHENTVESWVFSMRGDKIANLYKFSGIRLFARNVRGFLGENTPINRGMVDTLKTEPTRFFYYNNGITILCDEAKRESHQGKDILHVSNPQVINGQQTTRTLSAHPDLAEKPVF